MKQIALILGNIGRFSTLVCRHTPKRFILVALALLVQLALVPVAPAATLTWDTNSVTAGAQDGSGNWDTNTANWWNGSTSIAWTNANGDNAIFGAGGAGGTVTLPTTSPNIVVGNITFNTNYTLANSSGTLTLTNYPTITTATGTSNIIGSFVSGTSFTKEGAGVLVLNPGGNNTYTGQTIINNGILQCGGNDARIYINGDLQVNPAGTFRFTSGGAAGGVILPSATLVVNGGTVAANVSGKYLPFAKLVLDNNGAIIMAPTAAGNCYFDPTNIDARSGYIYPNLYRAIIMTLVKATAGTMIISNRPNTAGTDGYIVSMNAGTLIFDKSSQSANRLLPNAVLTLGGGSLVFSNGNSTINPTAENPGTAGTTINPGASSVSGNNAGASGGNATFGALTRKVGGTLDIASKTGSGTFSTTTANNNAILGGWATWAGADWLVGTTFAAYSAYTTGIDPTTWVAANNVSLVGNPSPNSDDVTINSLRLTAASTVTINSAKTLTLSSGGLLVTGSGATAITGGSLTGGASGGDLVVIQNSSADLTISSTLANNGGSSLTKSGSGKLVLSPAANNMTGTNYFNGGVVEVSDLSALASGPLVMNAGTLRYTGTDTTNTHAITLNGLGGTFDVSSSGTTLVVTNNLNNSDGVQIVNATAGSLMGNLGGLSKIGSGKLVLTGSNYFNGLTVVSNGTLLVNGTNTYDLTTFNAGRVAVYGGVLGGTGKIMGAVTVKNGGTISPGASVGTLALATNLTLESGSTSLFEESNSVAGDLLQVQGNLTIQTNCTIAVSILGAALEPVTNTLITYTGTKSGSFNPTVVVVGGSINGSVSIDESTAGQIKLAVIPQVVITSQPTNNAVSVGGNLTSSVAATGSSPLSYQWYFYGSSATNMPIPVADQTNTVFSLANAQLTNSGLYAVVVTNIYNSVTSSFAGLIVGNYCPDLSGPNSLIVTQDNSGTFTVTVILANPQPAFQWQTNGVNVAGATNSSLTFTNIQHALNATTVSVIVSNAACMETNSAILTVLVPPTITPQPTNITVNVGDAVTLVSGADGHPAPSLQWRKNGVNIPNQTNATLFFASALGSDNGVYSLMATNTAGTVFSFNATLQVNSTTLAQTTVSPANSATGVCYDTPLYVTFNGAISIVNSGKIRIYNATNPVTPVDTIDMGANTVIISTLNAGLGITLTNNVQAHSLFQGDSTLFNYFPVIITNNTAAIYPHSGVLTSNQTYYVTMDSGIVKNSAGAYFAGISDTNAWRFTTKPAGPANPTNLVVAADGSGDFVTVQGAVDSIPLNNINYTLINIRNGNYVEIVNISGKTNVTFRGQSRTGTVVGYGNNANIAPGGSTASRMAFKVNGSYIAIENMTVVNRTPQGGSQAETIMINTGASRFIVNNCDVNSLQDTILANVNSAQGYFYNTTVRGNFDYIWGGGNLFFTNCLIFTIPNIYVTNNFNMNAARTDFNVTSNATYRWLNPAGSYTADGFSYVKCRLQADPAVTTITLEGANGTANGLVSFINCLIDTNHYVTPAAGILSTYVLWEYANSNIDGTLPVSLGLTVLTNNDPRLLAAQSVTNWLYGWMPALAPNIIGQPANQSVSQGQSANFIVTATGIPDPTYQWLKDGSPITGATATNYSIASAVATNAGSYAVVVSNGSGSVTSIVATLTYNNTAPVANPSTYSRPAGYPLNIIIAGNLATNWSDADGDPLALTSGISSTNAATVSYDSSYVYYTNANDVADQINYTVGDGQGGTAASVINVVVGPPPTNSIAGTVVNGNGSVTLSFVGVPDYTYLVEATLDLMPPVVWTPVSTNTADINGLWQFTDTQATNYTQRFYRSVYWP
jgi:autotransporter-associated beta strand protein